MTKWERVEVVRDYAETRNTLIAVAQLQTVLGLALLEIGQRIGRPRMARRAAGQLVQACDLWRRAGLGRKAVAVARLLERCRRAWNRYEELEGFR